MSRYTTIMFDADATLLDFDAAEDSALIQTFKKYNYPYNEFIKEQYLKINKELWNAYEKGEMSREQVIYTRFKRLFKELGIDDEGISFEDDYQLCLGSSHELIEYAMEVVKELSKDYTLYIASNGVSATQYQRLDESGLRPYFKDVFVSEEIGFQKPDLAYFTSCFDKMESVLKHDILLVGDSLSSDMQGGMNAGIATCWYNPKKQENKDKVSITYEIRDLRELYTIVGKESSMSEKKKVDTKTLLERSRQAKHKPQSKMLEKKLGKKKNSDKFGKVNFNG